jgi:deoxyuridine 5'-triphosphate nucleotidohydrolase
MSFRYMLTLPNAIPPRKAHHEDTGYDLHLVKLLKEENGVKYYDTGVVVEPSAGCYFELVGRSSISKSGYMLANNVGILDQNYRGNVIAALVKWRDEAPDLELPARIVQLIPRQFIHLEPVLADSLSETVRGAGGFGSTNEKFSSSSSDPVSISSPVSAALEFSNTHNALAYHAMQQRIDELERQLCPFDESVSYKSILNREWQQCRRANPDFAPKYLSIQSSEGDWHCQLEFEGFVWQGEPHKKKKVTENHAAFLCCRDMRLAA